MLTFLKLSASIEFKVKKGPYVISKTKNKKKTLQGLKKAHC